MNRGFLGLILLLVILIGGIMSARFMVCSNSPLEQTMDQAAELVLDDRWDQAERIRLEAQAQWQSRWHLAAAFADHAPMEEVDSLFAQLEVYARKRDQLGYAALCRELARELAAMGDAHVPSWWNLL